MDNLKWTYLSETGEWVFSVRRTNQTVAFYISCYVINYDSVLREYARRIAEGWVRPWQK